MAKRKCRCKCKTGKRKRDNHQLGKSAEEHEAWLAEEEMKARHGEED